MDDEGSWTVVTRPKRGYRKGTSFSSIAELYDYWFEKKFGFEIGMQMMQEFYKVKYETVRMIWYILQKPRATEELINRLVKADRIKGFDWYSVLRGREEQELKKYGL
jgi:hypothetical protein